MSNCEVNRCKFFNIFDTGVTNQYFGGAPAQNQANIFYYNNLFYNCGLASLEIANQSGGTEDNIRFINNTSLFAGYGWGQPNGIQQHTAANPAAFPKLGGAIIGASLVFYMAFNATNSIQIRNNIFYGSWDMFVFRLIDLWGPSVWAQTTFSNNSYFSASGNKNAPNPSNLCVAFNTSTNQVDYPETYSWNEFYYQGPPTYKGWQTQKDLNAIQLYDGNAVFNDVYGGDYRLKSNSPCVNVGTNSVLSYPGLDKDIRGNITRPQNGTADMGAYEYSTGSGRLAMVEQSPENDIMFYPNPITDGKLNLSITDPEAQVSLTDMLGHTALMKKGITGPIDVSKLDMGTYVLKVVTQGVTHRKKVLIVR